MPPLTADVHRMHSVHQPQFLPFPVKGGARLYLNAITCTDSDGFAVPGEDALGLASRASPGSRSTTPTAPTAP